MDFLKEAGEKLRALNAEVYAVKRRVAADESFVTALVLLAYLTEVDQRQLKILGNVALILYDIALSKIILLYLVKIRHHMGLKNYFSN